jgi:hypothetical protein
MFSPFSGVLLHEPEPQALRGMPGDAVVMGRMPRLAFLKKFARILSGERAKRFERSEMLMRPAWRSARKERLVSSGFRLGSASSRPWAIGPWRPANCMWPNSSSRR